MIKRAKLQKEKSKSSVGVPSSLPQTQGTTLRIPVPKGGYNGSYWKNWPHMQMFLNFFVPMVLVNQESRSHYLKVADEFFCWIDSQQSFQTYEVLLLKFFLYKRAQLDSNVSKIIASFII